MNAIPQLDLTMDEQRMGRGTRPETQEIAYAYLSAAGGPMKRSASSWAGSSWNSARGPGCA